MRQVTTGSVGITADTFVSVSSNPSTKAALVHVLSLATR